MAANTDRLAVLRTGLRWLYQTVQPEGAIFQHGARLRAGERYFDFVPCGWRNRVVVVAHVTFPEKALDVDGEWALVNPLEPGELGELTRVLADLGERVVHTWNGHPGEAGSLALARPAHASLRAAVDRYHAGCPTHHTVFCASDGCSWYRDGSLRMIMPKVLSGQPEGATP